MQEPKDPNTHPAVSYFGSLSDLQSALSNSIVLLNWHHIAKNVIEQAAITNIAAFKRMETGLYVFFCTNLANTQWYTGYYDLVQGRFYFRDIKIGE